MDSASSSAWLDAQFWILISAETRYPEAYPEAKAKANAKAKARAKANRAGAQAAGA
jgi:hypothetical protein